MDKAVLKFGEMPWVNVSELVRQKIIQHDGRRVRLLQIKPGFAEPDWCMRGHLGIVLQGSIEIEFDDGVKRFSTGDGLMVSSGVPHKACRTSETVTLFLVDDEA